MTGRWFIRPVTVPEPALRLVCIPYAGGAASVYRGWGQLAPREVEVCAVELPGRGSRISEAPFSHLMSLVRALGDALEPLLDRPFALFGHSMGGLVAFELARLLRQRGWPAPRHLFVSATPAPGTPPARPLLHRTSDAELIDRLRELNGTPQEILDHAELMALLLPVIRADFAALETHEPREEPPLDVPLTVFGGVLDRRVRPAALEGWRAHSTAATRLRLWPGDHFYLHGAARELVGAVVEDLALGPSPAHPASPDTPGEGPLGDER
ncbi:MAG TPA: alpha/beta fold hydrolase [Kofleriaceae bacterium]